MNLNVRKTFYGLMLYWNKVENAAVYHVHLSINNGYGAVISLQEIASVDVPRNIMYYSFSNLGDLHYFISVEAEDRNGNIIEISDFIESTVLSIKDLEINELKLLVNEAKKAAEDAGKSARAAGRHTVGI